MEHMNLAANGYPIGVMIAKTTSGKQVYRHHTQAM